MTDPQQYEVAAMVERLREAVENYDEDIYALAMKAAALLERLALDREIMREARELLVKLRATMKEALMTGPSVDRIDALLTRMEGL